MLHTSNKDHNCISRCRSFTITEQSRCKIETALCI